MNDLQAPQDPWDEFLDHVIAYVNARQAEFREINGQHDRFDVDLEKGLMVFSTDGEPRVECDVIVAGSYAESSGTWLWSWANPHLPHPITQRFAEVLAYGGERGG